ncbi:MAG TPA: hypothetical protein VHS81_05180 [Caulobacteraceae bacterium]|nr:hypothetical protein [Caulobacteraceae bacterium]
MTTLMGFVLNTLKPRVNDPKNAKLWLPALLMSMRNDSGPVLPIHARDQDLGALQGQGGAYVADRFNQVYGILNGVDSEPDPAAPLPLLSLPDATLDGLQNLTVGATRDTPKPDGYGVDVDLIFDLYSGEVGGIQMPPLTISGRYHIDQSLLVTDTNQKTTITGDGGFSVTITQAKMVANAIMQVTGSGARRTNTITLQALALTGVQDGAPPVMDFTELTLDSDLPQKDVVIGAIQNALSDPEGQKAILSGVSAMLNSPSNLASVNGLVSDKTGGVLDGIFGPLPSSGLPVDGPSQKALTPIDQYLFDRVRQALSEPASSWFLPLQLATTQDPILEPYTNSRVEVPDQTIKGLKYTSIVITDIVLAGASNAIAPLDETVLATTKFSSRLAFATLPAGPARQVGRPGGPVSMPVPAAPPLRFSAGFSLVQQGIRPVSLKGSLTATLADVFAPITVAPSGADVDHLKLTLSGVSADISAAQITPQVTLDPHNNALEQILNTLFAKPDVQQQILASLNNALAQQSGAISDQFTKIARDAIRAQIGD